MTEQQFEKGEEVLVRVDVNSGPNINGLYAVSYGRMMFYVSAEGLHKITTGKNSFWTEASDTQTIDGQCGGCGFIGMVSVHKLCALCGWWSRKTDWAPRATLIVPNDYEEIPHRPGVYRSTSEPSLWQRIKRWWTEQGDW